METECEIYRFKYSPLYDTRQKVALKKRVDLLEKTKRTELVDYWRDTARLRQYMLQAIDEYKDLKNKEALLK